MDSHVGHEGGFSLDKYTQSLYSYGSQNLLVIINKLLSPESSYLKMYIYQEIMNNV